MHSRTQAAIITTKLCHFNVQLLFHWHCSRVTAGWVQSFEQERLGTYFLSQAEYSEYCQTNSVSTMKETCQTSTLSKNHHKSLMTIMTARNSTSVLTVHYVVVCDRNLSKLAAKSLHFQYSLLICTVSNSIAM